MATDRDPASTRLDGRDEKIELTVLMPCLNEAETLETCITKAKACLARMGVEGEVLIADNGSSDGSQKIAQDNGARVAHIKDRGYGAALLGGIAAARGRFIIMGDADDSYDFTRLDPFLEKLREGYDLVMGNRFLGGIAPGAMPPLHYYFGNPVLTAIGRLFFSKKVGDFNCGLRGFSKQAAERMELQTTGMEFASEMVVKASLHQLKIAEVPTTLAKDGRSRPPHLRSWRDGWRNLRFLLIFCPRWLFLIPGLVLIVLGLILVGRLGISPWNIGGVTLDVHTMMYGAAMVLLGFQAVMLSVFARTFAASAGLIPQSERLQTWIDQFQLEYGLIAGLGLVGIGIGLAIYAMVDWGWTGFGPWVSSHSMRIVILSVLAMTLGAQLAMGSFMMSLLRLARKK